MEPSRQQLVGMVTEAAQCDNPRLRAEILRLVAATRIQEVSGLLTTGLDDDSTLVRLSALQGQLQVGMADAEPGLLVLLNDGDERVRLTALEIILELGGDDLIRLGLERALRNFDSTIGQLALRYALQANDDGLTASAQVMERYLQSDDPMLVAATVQRLGVNPIEAIGEDLFSELAEERYGALSVLGVVDSLDVWPLLRWLSEHGDDTERILATIGLARMGDESSHDEVLELVRQRSEPYLSLAIRSLVGRPNESVHELLRDNQRSPNADLRLASLVALHDMDAPSYQIIDFLDDEDHRVADQASVFLESAHPGGVLPYLCSELQQQDPSSSGRVLRLIWGWLVSSDASLSLQGCQSTLDDLMTSDDSELSGLAARIHFRVNPPDRGLDMSGFLDNDVVLYAFLESTLTENPDGFHQIYLDLLNHDRAAVRALAALGLLRGTE